MLVTHNKEELIEMSCGEMILSCVLSDWNSSFLMDKRGFRLQRRSCALIVVDGEGWNGEQVDTLMALVKACRVELNIYSLFVNGFVDKHLLSVVEGHENLQVQSKRMFNETPYRPGEDTPEGIKCFGNQNIRIQPYRSHYAILHVLCLII